VITLNLVFRIPFITPCDITTMLHIIIVMEFAVNIHINKFQVMISSEYNSIASIQL